MAPDTQSTRGLVSRDEGLTSGSIHQTHQLRSWPDVRDTRETPNFPARRLAQYWRVESGERSPTDAEPPIGEGKVHTCRDVVKMSIVCTLRMLLGSSNDKKSTPRASGIS